MPGDAHRVDSLCQRPTRHPLPDEATQQWHATAPTQNAAPAKQPALLQRNAKLRLLATGLSRPEPAQTIDRGSKCRLYRAAVAHIDSGVGCAAVCSIY